MIHVAIDWAQSVKLSTTKLIWLIQGCSQVKPDNLGEPPLPPKIEERNKMRTNSAIYKQFTSTSSSSNMTLCPHFGVKNKAPMTKVFFNVKVHETQSHVTHVNVQHDMALIKFKQGEIIQRPLWKISKIWSDTCHGLLPSTISIDTNFSSWGVNFFASCHNLNTELMSDLELVEPSVLHQNCVASELMSVL